VTAVLVGTAVYLTVIGAFRLTGHWHGSVSESEYAGHIAHIDSPLYTHVGGMAGGAAPAGR
jgi:hypothetical protein